MKAIILVAGYATRLYPLTLNRPKALLDIGGKPIIDYIVDQINTIDAVDEIYVVSNHKFADQFYQWAESRKKGIVITVIGVFGIVFTTMLYGMNKLKKENVMDALKKENI